MPAKIFLGSQASTVVSRALELTNPDSVLTSWSCRMAQKLPGRRTREIMPRMAMKRARILPEKYSPRVIPRLRTASLRQSGSREREEPARKTTACIQRTI